MNLSAANMMRHVVVDKSHTDAGSAIRRLDRLFNHIRSIDHRTPGLGRQVVLANHNSIDCCGRKRSQLLLASVKRGDVRWETIIRGAQWT